MISPKEEGNCARSPATMIVGENNSSMSRGQGEAGKGKACTESSCLVLGLAPKGKDPELERFKIS